MSRRISPLVIRTIIGALTALILAPSGAVGAADRAHVVVMSIDGLMPQCLLDADRLGLEIPNLRGLMARGAWADGVVGVLPTKTYPSHTTLITGVLPLRHGIYANNRFDPQTRPNNGFFWFTEDIRTETLVSSAAKSGLTTATVYWPVSVGMDSNWNVPEVWFPTSTHRSDVRFLRLLSTPGVLDDAIGRDSLDRMASLEEFTDDERVAAATHLIRNHRPDLTLLHVFGLDFAEHDHGPMTPEALAWVERSDRYVGAVLKAIDDAGIAETTTVVIVSDHGFVGSTREVRPNVLLAQLGLISVGKDGTVEDWRAIFESETGSALLHARDEEAVRLVRSVIAPLLGDESSGILAAANRDEAREMGLDVPFAIDAREGYRFSDAVTGPYLGEEGPVRGDHGYFPTRKEVMATFVIAGPRIRATGSIGVIRMTRIGPTIASLLGISLDPEADIALPLFEATAAEEGSR